MLEEVIWVSGAAQEYLEANPKLVSSEAIDALIELVRLFPDIGSKVSASKRIQRVLVGRNKIYGLFYSVTGKRLIIVALIDLRQSPAEIENVLRRRVQES